MSAPAIPTSAGESDLIAAREAAATYFEALGWASDPMPLRDGRVDHGAFVQIALIAIRNERARHGEQLLRVERERDEEIFYRAMEQMLKMQAQSALIDAKASLAKMREALEQIASWSTVSGMHEQDRDKRLRSIALIAIGDTP